ncbi:amino acid racemase [Rubrivirga sp. S365]|uniref:Amino acid racemase n=1 Tax=Rubrivirga litoralis TaxID=3075598 RepID=A0ABU3BPP5_9BACT|nr:MULTISPECIES: amino acid racemase [unclassified Rubrivirga]MDT0631260.1 amino acid racemase [Rubrivirga sp. F394]MDT7856037.1 amino acid racemase [Rubrivirga sp. S365]
MTAPLHARPIGVVGGVGPRAGLDLVQKVLAATRAERDQDHLPLTLLSHPHRIPDRTAFLLGHDTENPGEAIADLASALVDGGAEVVGVPCHTAHAAAVFDVVRERVAGRCTLVDMVEEVGREITERFPRARRVGVLSTTGTMAAGVYPDRLGPLGLEVLQLPPALQQTTVQPAIYDPTYGLKSVSDPVSARAAGGLQSGLDHLLRGGAEVVVLACTEIPLALREPTVGGVPLLDATAVLARALVRESCPAALTDP